MLVNSGACVKTGKVGDCQLANAVRSQTSGLIISLRHARSTIQVCASTSATDRVIDSPVPTENSIGPISRHSWDSAHPVQIVANRRPSGDAGHAGGLRSADPQSHQGASCTDRLLGLAPIALIGPRSAEAKNPHLKAATEFSAGTPPPGFDMDWDVGE